MSGDILNSGSSHREITEKNDSARNVDQESECAEEKPKNGVSKPKRQWVNSRRKKQNAGKDLSVAESKRKRIRDDPESPNLKLPHRDSSLGSSCSGSSASCDSPRKKKESTRPVEYETDPVVLARRQKQIDYGKNTMGYDRYIQLVPKNKRERSHPTTPVKHLKYSRRGFDCLVKTWRLKLHEWDLPDSQEEPENTVDLHDSQKETKDN